MSGEEFEDFVLYGREKAERERGMEMGMEEDRNQPLGHEERVEAIDLQVFGDSVFFVEPTIPGESLSSTSSSSMQQVVIPEVRLLPHHVAGPHRRDHGGSLQAAGGVADEEAGSVSRPVTSLGREAEQAQVPAHPHPCSAQAFYPVAAGPVGADREDAAARARRALQVDPQMSHMK